MAHWHNKVSIAEFIDPDNDLTFAQRKEGVAKVLQEFRDSKPWLDPEGELDLAISNVRDARNEEDYDACMGDVYDWGDQGHRLWIDSIRVVMG